MKSITFLIILLSNFSSTFCDRDNPELPELKPGKTFEYEILSRGNAIPMSLTIVSVGDEGISFDFMIRQMVSGKFINKKINLEKGESLNWDSPVPGEVRELPENQTLAMVSRIFLAGLKKNKTARYDGIDFVHKPIPSGSEISVNGCELDAVYAESENGETKYWILNNDRFPLLLKTEGAAGAPDLVLRAIK